MSKRHRSHSRHIANTVVAVSVSYQRDNMLSRGFGIEHLREMLFRLMRPLIRQGASIAYGGHWGEAPDNFTYELLRLISAEQDDTVAIDTGPQSQIGLLINHAAWPYYMKITPLIEAEWIRCCRILRVTQEMAGLSSDSIVRDDPVDFESDRVKFNAAVTLSAMRQMVVSGMTLQVPSRNEESMIEEKVPATSARIVLGGKVSGFSGFMPGIVEEVLLASEHRKPIYLLGGFGGAAELLSRALLSDDDRLPPELTVDWHRDENPELNELITLSKEFAMPDRIRSAAECFDALSVCIRSGRNDLSSFLNTGLGEAETRELLTTRDMARAVNLVHQGLASRVGLQET